MPARVFYSENLTCFDAEQQIRKLVSVDIVRRDQSVTRSSSEAAPVFEPPSLVAVLGQRRLQRESLSRRRADAVRAALLGPYRPPRWYAALVSS